MNDTGSPSKTPRIEVTVAAPVDAVWHALRDRDLIRHWHGWEYDQYEAEIDVIYFQDFTEDVETHTLEVQGGDRFVLEPTETGTRVILTRAPLSGDPEWDAYYDDVTEGWITFLHQLRFAVERRPGATRRTLFFSGQAGQAGPVADELGLAAVAHQPAGTEYHAELAGERVSGQLWFRSDHQLGLTVDTWGGEGLLVVSYIPPSSGRPDGVAMAILSTYGLPEEQLTALQQRWSTWWNARYPSAAE